MTEQELKDLKESVDKIHAALPALFAFRDNHLLWMKETGLFDLIVQDVLSKVPTGSAPSTEIAALRSEVAMLSFKVAELEARTPGSAGTPFPSGAQVISGDVVFTGRVGIGGIREGNNCQLHIVASPATSGDAQIVFQNSNGDVAQKSLSNDGGFRDLNNEETRYESKQNIDPDTGQTFTDNLWVVKPNKIHSQIGTDSKHQPSWKRVDPNWPHEYTQDLVMKFYEDQKIVSLESWRKGWNIKFAVDAKYGPARFSDVAV